MANRNSIARQEARTALSGAWLKAALMAFVFFLIALLFETPVQLPTVLKLHVPLTTRAYLGGGSFLLMIFVYLPLCFGLMVTALDIFRGNKECPTGQMLRNGFQWNYFRGLGVMFLQGLYIILWSLLLLIPGIIKSYAYRMSCFIARDYPNIPIDDCIHLSRKLMKGHKGELFLMDLGFALLGLLSILTACIALFWLVPYMYCSYAAFYERLRQEQGDPIFEDLKNFNVK